MSTIGLHFGGAQICGAGNAYRLHAVLPSRGERAHDKIRIDFKAFAASDVRRQFVGVPHGQ